MLRNAEPTRNYYKPVAKISECGTKATYEFPLGENKSSIHLYYVIEQKTRYKIKNRMIPNSVSVLRKKYNSAILVELSLPEKQVVITDKKICIGEKQYDGSVEVDINGFIAYLETRQLPTKKNKASNNLDPNYIEDEIEYVKIDDSDDEQYGQQNSPLLDSANLDDDEIYKKTINKIQVIADRTPKREIPNNGKNYFPLSGDLETQEKKRKALEKFSLHAVPFQQGKMEQETKQFKK